MEERLKKYESLEEKANIVKCVGEKILDLIETNNVSMEWYERFIAGKLAENPEADVGYLRERINHLEKENEIIMELEMFFWNKYAF